MPLILMVVDGARSNVIRQQLIAGVLCVIAGFSLGLIFLHS